LAFTVRRHHPDYAGQLSLDETARFVLGAVGRRGTCRDYLDNTLRHLNEFGIVDAALRRLAERIATLTTFDPLPGRPSERL